MKINIQGLDKAKLLQALFNNSKPLGLGFFDKDSNKEMTYTEAQQIVAEGMDFDYLNGRVMKIDLSGDELDPCGYDCENGQGSVLKVVTALKNGVEVAFNKAAPTNKMEALAAQGKIHEAMDEAPIRILQYCTRR
ncbi:MAG: hypothetical protein A3F42_08125 [Gammaproteobacteria bacterium RIFCSPHIGHO2_12_FULL_37_34]|nr:MAG: hypothetical protein A3F42_08125 [Gammaproteobacteria bacterium RIFCSPHIGHO2_12_FULL_37_34]